MSGPEYKLVDVRVRLSNHFKSASAADLGEKWNDLYKEGYVPWEKGHPNPALEDLLQFRKDLLGEPFVHGGNKRKRALVPGCGLGHDVFLLSAFGYDAYGLEYSQVAIDAARKGQEKKEEEQGYRARDERGKGEVKWLVGDFFNPETVESVDGDKKFDLIYDYTFLSSLPISLRPAWSLRMNQLLAKEGRLVCLEYPTYKPHNTGGPPFALPPKVYFGHLPRPGQEVSYDDEDGLLEEKLGPPEEAGLHRLAHFQPERTHDAGWKDGKITDWISIWAHEGVE